MLVLTRKKNDVIDIEGVKVKVISIRSNKVRIGIEAPDGVRIVREELLENESVERGQEVDSGVH